MQLPAHAVGPHVFGAQETSCSGGHEPLPSHDAASTAMPELQDGSRHVVPLPGYVQAAGWIPSHVPAQTEPSEAQAVRALRGPPATDVQVPTLPFSAQASHWPVQAVSQQTPSTQCGDPHWFAPPQACPGGERLQALIAWLHAAGPQLKGAHVCVCRAGQVPAPSHDAASVAVPPAQEALRQETELPG